MNKYEETKEYIKDLERDIQDNFGYIEQSVADAERAHKDLLYGINLNISTIKSSYKRIEELKEELEKLTVGY